MSDNRFNRAQSARRVQDQIIEPLNHEFYGETQYELVCRLDRKRRQLQREIEQFKASKDAEYRTYEHEIKKYYEREGELPQETKEEEMLQQRQEVKQEAAICALSTPPNSQQKENANNTQMKKEGAADTGKPIITLHDAASASRPKSSPRGSPSPPYLADATKLSHSHERELQGVFTPSYLPLLDGMTNGGDRRSSSELLEASSLNQKESLLTTRSNTAGLSSSAEYHHPPLTSPPAPPARPLSASVPQEESLGHRRSSSESRASLANRRSSLRKSNEPRALKRVLFSIDDTVVSPSTSPIAQRSNSVTPVKPSRSPTSSHFKENFEVVEDKQAKSMPAAHPLLSTVLGSSYSAPASISPLRRTYESSEGRNRTSPLIGGDDFEHVDGDDDLFTFDEDLEFGDSKKVKDEEMGRIELGAEDDKVRNEPLTGSSPHAGSLPIEIKWPGRRLGS